MLETPKGWFQNHNKVIKTQKGYKRPTANLQVEVLEDRYCPAGNTWQPVDAGNFYSDPDNWTAKHVGTEELIPAIP
jgi:hypothetical protein